MLFLFSQLPPPTSGFWPTTLVGYLSAIGALIAIFGGLWGYAKFMAHLNGLGDRVNAVEKDLKEAKTRLTDFAIAAEKLIDHHRILSDKIAEAVSRSNRLHEENTEMRIDVAGFIAGLKDEMNKTFSMLNGTIAGLQSDVRHLSGRSTRT